MYRELSEARIKELRQKLTLLVGAEGEGGARFTFNDFYDLDFALDIHPMKVEGVLTLIKSKATNYDVAQKMPPSKQAMFYSNAMQTIYKECSSVFEGRRLFADWLCSEYGVHVSMKEIPNNNE